MFPSLHDNVAQAVSETVGPIWFCEKHDNSKFEEQYETHVMGRFWCTSPTCAGKGWTSKKVAIVIKGYTENGYNAIVFKQRCKACNRLGSLKLDEQSYIDRVAYRIQKWAGIQMEKQPFSEKKGLPHKRDLCEGCKQGVCRESLSQAFEILVL